MTKEVYWYIDISRAFNLKYTENSANNSIKTFISAFVPLGLGGSS